MKLPNLPLPPFAWPIVVVFALGWVVALTAKFPLLGLSSHFVFGLLFWSTVVAVLLLGLYLWWRERRQRRARP